MTNQEMVDWLVREGYLKTDRIIEAFRSVDRKHFVVNKKEAYLNAALPLLAGQTISQPLMVAIMIELLQPHKSDQVLEIGGGSGYVAALLSRLARKVTALEIEESLVSFAQQNLTKAKISNATILQRDGSKGLPGKLFDKILYSCSLPSIPKDVMNQLKDPGCLVAPVGTEGYQITTVFRKEGGTLTETHHDGCIFLPLRKP